jgi:uncharacterized protein DUF6493
MAKSFVPESPLEKLVYQGKRDEVVGLLRGLGATERQKLRGEVARLVKITQAARFAFSDDTFAGWGRLPTDEQLRAIAVAALLCGTAKDAAESYVDIDEVIALGREFNPPSMAQMPEEMLRTTGWRWRIHDVQKLIGAGVASRPDTNEYVLGLMLLFSHWPKHDLDVDQHFAADPGLKQALLRIFEVEGVSDVSLAAVDKYAKGGRTWSKRLLELAQRGVYSRELLLDKTLSALERGWIQFRSGWFSQFHELLAPTIAEMKPHAQRYVALMASRIPPTVTFALGAVKDLEKAGGLEPRATLQGVRPVFSSAVKSQVDNALKLVDKLVKSTPAISADAANVIVPALAHESAELQQQILKRFEAWKVDVAARREMLKPYASGIAATNREALSRLIGANAASSERAAGEPAPTPAATASRSSLDASRRVVPIADLDELVERTAYVFENDTDIDEFERVMAELVRHAPLSEDVRGRFAPLARRIGKVRKPVAQQLARLLEFLLTGNRTAADSTVDHGGNKAKAQLHLIERVNDLMDFACGSRGESPLGTPTHRRGFIDATEFVRRMVAHQSAGVKSSRADFLVGLMRLAPESAAQARQELARLGDDPLSQALRFALGEDVKVRDRELAGAASRMRRLCSGTGHVEFTWNVESKEYGNNRTHTRVAVDCREDPANADPVLALASSIKRSKADAWYHFPTVGGIDEGSILYFASLMPADLELLFAEGAALLSRNIDWWEAQWENAAYLRQLLHSDVPMKPMATLTLALGLAGKEPGQTAVAVDALVQSHAEGRLDVGLLAADIRECLRTDHAACARYSKSLRAALRIDPGVAGALFAILCEAVAARPADPPKDTAALMELLLELAVSQAAKVPDATRAVLDGMQIGGKGKALRAKLLALPA